MGPGHESSAAPEPELVVLTRDCRPARPLALTMGLATGTGQGATTRQASDASWWRAEQGSRGPVLLHVRAEDDGLALDVLGRPGTPAAEVEAAVHAAWSWVGVHDDLTGLGDLLSGHPVLGRLLARLGPPVLGVLPRAAESFGIALLGQRVHSVEARRSTARLLRLLGTPAAPGLYAYPSRTALHGAAAHALRPCGISVGSTQALRRFAADEPAAQRLARARDWTRLDVLIRRVAGCGAWTSAETRLHLGDADAVSYGDVHTASVVGWAIGERTETDEAMAELLAPFAPHRGRVVRLIERAARQGLVPTKPRHAPRTAFAGHRYG